MPNGMRMMIGDTGALVLTTNDFAIHAKRVKSGRHIAASPMVRGDVCAARTRPETEGGHVFEADMMLCVTAGSLDFTRRGGAAV